MYMLGKEDRNRTAILINDIKSETAFYYLYIISINEKLKTCLCNYKLIIVTCMWNFVGNIFSLKRICPELLVQPAE